MCISPLTIGLNTFKCGQCTECLIQRSQEWAFRLEQEAKDSSSGVFLTLTLDDENQIWVDTDEGQTVTTLHKPDVQKFLKRLRHAQGPLKNKQDYKEKLRYFLCGEYGETTQRAHYHAIIFNLKKEVIQKLDTIWNKGHIKVGDVTSKSIRYVTNYMLLKNANHVKPQQKPFTLMSRKPILGARYVVNNYYQHHEQKSVELVSKTKQRRVLYNCYKRKIFTNEDLPEINAKAQEIFEQRKEEFRQKILDKYPDDPFAGEQQERDHRKYILNKRRKQRL